MIFFNNVIGDPLSRVQSEVTARNFYSIRSD